MFNYKKIKKKKVTQRRLIKATYGHKAATVLLIKVGGGREIRNRRRREPTVDANGIFRLLQRASLLRDKLHRRHNERIKLLFKQAGLFGEITPIIERIKGWINELYHSGHS